MSGTTEVFVAIHQAAVKRAAALDAAFADLSEGAADGLPDVPHTRINGVTDLEIEILGSLAAKAVHASGGDHVLDLADVSSDSLMVVPDDMVRSLAELLTVKDEEDNSLIPVVAEQWAAQEDMPFDGAVAEECVRRLAELAAASEGGHRQQLYVWSHAD
jgi:hypothetical protein